MHFRTLKTAAIVSLASIHLVLGASASAQLPGGSWLNPGPNPSPGKLFGAGIAYDSMRDQVILVCGSTGTGMPSRTWIWGPGPMTWTPHNGTSPTGVSGGSEGMMDMAIAYDLIHGWIFLFGGMRNTTTYFQNTWKWDGTNWSKITCTGSIPSARCGARMVFDPITGLFILFGGFDGSKALDDTYTFDPVNYVWSSVPIPPGGAPAPRFQHAMVFDQHNGCVLLFGGSYDNTQPAAAFGDTWELRWNGVSWAWTQLFPLNSPSPRTAHHMAYDPELKLTYLVGGMLDRATPRYDDTWIWNGNDWNLVTVTGSSPQGRAFGAFTFDQVNRSPLLYGGEPVEGTVVGDTWLLNPVFVEIYCTAKPNSLGCTPTIGFSGYPSMSDPKPFYITADYVINNKNGLLFYGYAPAATPFHGGFLCVQPPMIKRTPVQNSGGNPPPNDCSGTFAVDMNAWIQSGADPNLVLGQFVGCQYWSRDPQDPAGFGDSLTDAVGLSILP